MSAPGSAGASRDEARSSGNSAARMQSVHQGLKKVVTGRESVIKAQAVKLAEKLDAKTAGRHRQKIRVALMAVNTIVDSLGNRNAAGAEGAASAGDASRSTQQGTEPEDVGTFTDLGDRGRS